MKPVFPLFAAALVAALALPSLAAVKPTTKTVERPPIWDTVKPQLIQEVRRVARVDGTRLLAERIYGVELKGNTTVGDLVLQSDEVRTEVSRMIKGVAVVEKADFKEDGSLELVCAVKLRQVLETISRTIKENPAAGGGVKVEDVEKVEKKNQDKILDVVGNAAIPHSPGHKKILAKRAAELDAYRNLAERLLGVQVTSSTTVRNLVLESDKVLARTAQMLRGAKPTAIEYEGDRACEVTMEVKVAEIFEIARRYAPKAAGDPSVVEYERKYETVTFSETGYGSVREEGAEEGGANVADSVSKTLNLPRKKTISREAEMVVKKLGEGVVLE